LAGSVHGVTDVLRFRWHGVSLPKSMRAVSAPWFFRAFPYPFTGPTGLDTACHTRRIQPWPLLAWFLNAIRPIFEVATLHRIVKGRLRTIRPSATPKPTLDGAWLSPRRGKAFAHGCPWRGAAVSCDQPTPYAKRYFCYEIGSREGWVQAAGRGEGYLQVRLSEKSPLQPFAINSIANSPKKGPAARQGRTQQWDHKEPRVYRNLHQNKANVLS
jgi:hypothetical protein